LNILELKGRKATNKKLVEWLKKKINRLTENKKRKKKNQGKSTYFS